MKNIFVILLILIAFSCKKDTINKYYNLEIFTGSNANIYGNWQYLYTVENGSWTSSQFTRKIPSINIKPIGYYELVKGDSILQFGKIEILKNYSYHAFIKFNTDKVYYVKDTTTTFVGFKNALCINYNCDILPYQSNTLIISYTVWGSGSGALEFQDYFNRIRN